MSSCARASTNWVPRGECSLCHRSVHQNPGRPRGALERSNGWIAERLRQAAALLAAQGANPFRVSAYRRAADAIESLDADVRGLAKTGGCAALEAMPGVGPSIAGAVAEMLATGRWGFLERLKGTADPVSLFCFVPGIGPSLAHKIQATLRINSLESLEAAAHDGHLRQVPGFGARRAAMFAMPWAHCLRGSGRLPRVSPMSRRLACCSTSIANTGIRQPADHCARSRQSASTGAAKPGCQSCIPREDRGTSPRSIRTRHWPISSGAQAIGW